jgi:hypothetical protein
MALFKSNPEKTLQRDIDAAKSNRDRLTAKLAETEGVIAERRRAAKALALSGANDPELDKAELAIRSAQDRAANYSDALAEVSQDLAALEQTQIENSDRKLRTETASEIAAMATNLENAAAKFDTAVAALSDVAGRAALFIPDALGLEAFAVSSRQQVPPAVELVAAVMRNHAAAVLSGSAAATLRKAEPVTAPPPKIPLTRVFLLRHVAWTDVDGNLQNSPAFFDRDLPPELAERAINMGAATILSDPRRRELNGTRPLREPPLASCVRLDADASAANEQTSQPEARIMHSVVDATFERIDRGGPYLLKTSAPNTPEAA